CPALTSLSRPADSQKDLERQIRIKKIGVAAELSHSMTSLRQFSPELPRKNNGVIANAPGAAIKIPNPCGPTLRISLAKTGKKRLYVPTKMLMMYAAAMLARMTGAF